MVNSSNLNPIIPDPKAEAESASKKVTPQGHPPGGDFRKSFDGRQNRSNQEPSSEAGKKQPTPSLFDISKTQGKQPPTPAHQPSDPFASSQDDNSIPSSTAQGNSAQTYAQRGAGEFEGYSSSEWSTSQSSSGETEQSYRGYASTASQSNKSDATSQRYTPSQSSEVDYSTQDFSARSYSYEQPETSRSTSEATHSSSYDTRAQDSQRKWTDQRPSYDNRSQEVRQGNNRTEKNDYANDRQQDVKSKSAYGEEKDSVTNETQGTEEEEALPSDGKPVKNKVAKESGRVAGEALSGEDSQAMIQPEGELSFEEQLAALQKRKGEKGTGKGIAGQNGLDEPSKMPGQMKEVGAKEPLSMIEEGVIPMMDAESETLSESFGMAAPLTEEEITSLSGTKPIEAVAQSQSSLKGKKVGKEGKEGEFNVAASAGGETSSSAKSQQKKLTGEGDANSAAAAQAFGGAAPQPGIAQTSQTPQPSQPMSPSNMKELVNKLVETIQVMQKGDTTNTTITLKQPPVLEGATVTLTTTSHATKEFNVSFANLSPQAKALIDMNMRDNSLTDSMAEKGFVVHIVTTSTQEERLFESEPAFRERQEQGKDQQEQQQQQRRRSAFNQQNEDEEEG